MSVPKLRFPEFEGEGEWGRKDIKSFSESYSGGTPSTTNKEYYIGNIPFIRSAEIDLAHTELFISFAGLRDSSAKMVKKGDVLIALYGANSGDVAISKIDGAINQAILCIRTNSSNVYLYQFLSYKQQHIISTYIQGGQGNLSGEIIKSLLIPFPSPPEQQKIADCLSSLDELIAAHKRKLDALKTHKKGLMQQLFPADGETVPRLRFPEFEYAGEWEEKRLGEIVDVNPRKYSIDDSKKVSFVPMSAVSEDGCLVAPEIRQFSEVKKGYTYFLDNDVLVAKITPCYENGKTALVSRLTNGYGAGSTEFHVFRSTDQILPRFLFTYLNTELVRNNGISSMAGSGGQQRVPASYFENLIALFPLKTEQQKIADCLSSLDELITAQAQKIEALKTHKNGLMQQLFPAGEE